MSSWKEEIQLKSVLPALSGEMGESLVGWVMSNEIIKYEGFWIIGG